MSAGPGLLQIFFMSCWLCALQLMGQLDEQARQRAPRIGSR